MRWRRGISGQEPTRKTASHDQVLVSRYLGQVLL